MKSPEHEINLEMIKAVSDRLTDQEKNFFFLHLDEGLVTYFYQWYDQEDIVNSILASMETNISLKMMFERLVEKYNENNTPKNAN